MASSCMIAEIARRVDTTLPSQYMATIPDYPNVGAASMRPRSLAGFEHKSLVGLPHA